MPSEMISARRAAPRWLDLVEEVDPGVVHHLEGLGVQAGQLVSVLVAIAENTAALYSAANQRQFGGSRGGSLKAAVGKLVDLGEVVGADTRSGYALVDPLLADWVRAGRLPD
jgi:hypothetical protein